MNYLFFRTVLIILLLPLFSLANDDLNELTQNNSKQLSALKENHAKTANLKFFQYPNNENLLKYIDEIDKRRNELHPDIVESFNEIAKALKEQGYRSEALDYFRRGLMLSYTILGENADLSKKILKNAIQGLNEKEAMKFEIEMLTEVQKHHEKNLNENKNSGIYSHNIYVDYRNQIDVYQHYKKEQQAIQLYEEALIFVKNGYEKNPEIYAKDFVKLIIRGVKEFSKPKQTLEKAQKILAKLPASTKVNRLQLEIADLKNDGFILYTLFSVLILLVLALLYYFKIYYSPLVRKISANPKELLHLTPTQLKRLLAKLKI